MLYKSWNPERWGTEEHMNKHNKSWLGRGTEEISKSWKEVGKRTHKILNLSGNSGFFITDRQNGWQQGRWHLLISTRRRQPCWRTTTWWTWSRRQPCWRSISLRTQGRRLGLWGLLLLLLFGRNLKLGLLRRAQMLTPNRRHDDIS